ncbi:MAG: hypothetical protein ABW328_13790, partial [Ilumatobacteraceae bacterium]
SPPAARSRRSPAARPAPLVDDPGDDEDASPGRRIVLVLVALAVLVGLGVGGFLLFGGGDDDDAAPTVSAEDTTSVSGKGTATESVPTTATGSAPTSTPATGAVGAPAAFPTAGDPIPTNVMIFTRLRSDSTRQLWSVDVDKAVDDPTRVQRVNTGGGSTWDNLPAVSPDRRLIAYTTARPGTYSLVVAAWDGGFKELMVDGQPLTVANDARATWSPDGTRLAYVANRGGAEDLFVFDARTGTEAQLTDDDLSEGDPAWSPTSEQIVYAVTTPDTGRDLVIIEASGGPTVTLTSEPGDDSDPAWSPDGTQIAFARRAATESAFNELFVIAADGTGLRPLVASTFDTGSTERGDSDPSWSPDGTRIAFESARDQGIWLVAADGLTDPGPVTRLDGWVSVHPAWR